MRRPAPPESQPEQPYRAIVEAARDGVWMLDEHDRVSYANRAMAEMLGYDVEELLGRPAGELLAGGEQLRGTPGRQEVCMRRSDGSNLWVELSANPLQDERGDYAGLVSIVVDTTERREARLQRERLEARLQQAQRLETVGQLAGGIAHDFNNLLAVILNYAHYVREQLPHDSPLREDVDEIRHAGERASELTHQLLVFGRRETVRPVVLDLNDVARDTQRLLGRTLGDDVELVVDLEPVECLVTADAAQLEQVVLNLVVNARDAMPDGGTIRVETARRDSQVMLAVCDEGGGMEPEVVARAFEPFFTTKPKGAGTGLGLATVYGTVTHAGGHAEIESEPGRGTTMRVWLPAASGSAPAEPEAPARGRRVRSGTATILLVEDDDAVRAVTSRILRTSGFDCLEARDGETALRLHDANRDSVDVVLTDVVMPGMSGRELADRLASDGDPPPTVFMSGWADDAVPSEILPPAAAVVRKPFTADALVRAVRAALPAD